MSPLGRGGIPHVERPPCHPEERESHPGQESETEQELQLRPGRQPERKHRQQDTERQQERFELDPTQKHRGRNSHQSHTERPARLHQPDLSFDITELLQIEIQQQFEDRIVESD